MNISVLIYNLHEFVEKILVYQLCCMISKVARMKLSPLNSNLRFSQQHFPMIFKTSSKQLKMHFSISIKNNMAQYNNNSLVNIYFSMSKYAHADNANRGKFVNKLNFLPSNMWFNVCCSMSERKSNRLLILHIFNKLLFTEFPWYCNSQIYFQSLRQITTTRLLRPKIF